MGCWVAGCSTGGAGVLRSAWMLYHFDGMSFSSRRNFVRFLSVVLAAMPTSFEASRRRDPRKVGSRYERAAALSTEPGCYTARRGGADGEGPMNRTLRLPRADGALTHYTLTGSAAVTPPSGPIRSRVGFAAVHVVADPLAAVNPTLEVALDWESDTRLPPLSLVARARRRRGDGHLAARHGVRLADGPRADPALGGRGEDDPGRRARVRGGHRSPRAGPARDARRRRGGVRGAVRVDRALRRSDHPDGEPRARRGGPDPGRLPEGLRPYPAARCASR